MMLWNHSPHISTTAQCRFLRCCWTAIKPLNKSFIHRHLYKAQNKDNQQVHLQQVTVHHRCEKTIPRSTRLPRFVPLPASPLDSHVNEWPSVNHARMEMKSRVLTHKMNHATCWEPKSSEQLSQHSEVAGLHRYSRWGVFLRLSIRGCILDSFFNPRPERVQLICFTITNQLGGHSETGRKINSLKCPCGKTRPFTG